MPIGLYFADKLKAREVVNNALEFDRVHMLVLEIQPAIVNQWLYGLISSKLFSLWWKEWKKHLFCQASTSFCLTLDADYVASDDEVRNSHQPIHHLFPFEIITNQILAGC